jgi:hypothetical protein
MPCLNAKRPKKKPGEDYYTSPHHKLERLPAEDHGWLSLQTGAAAAAGYLMSAISIFHECSRAAERSRLTLCSLCPIITGSGRGNWASA